jgi:hypothetical protein
MLQSKRFYLLHELTIITDYQKSFKAAVESTDDFPSYYLAYLK